LRDPELVIRTSGEERISNFLLWQIAYSELFFTKALWPDFDAQLLEAAIGSFQQRNRRFGGVNKEEDKTVKQRVITAVVALAFFYTSHLYRRNSHRIDGSLTCGNWCI
jgi:hypothetical protein